MTQNERRKKNKQTQAVQADYLKITVHDDGPRSKFNFYLIARR